MKLSQLIPLISQLGNYLKEAADHYMMLRASGQDVSPDIIAAYLSTRLANWEPKIGNVNLLDEDTRAAGARFLAGIAINLAKS